MTRGPEWHRQRRCSEIASPPGPSGSEAPEVDVHRVVMARDLLLVATTGDLAPTEVLRQPTHPVLLEVTVDRPGRDPNAVVWARIRRDPLRTKMIPLAKVKSFLDDRRRGGQARASRTGTRGLVDETVFPVALGGPISAVERVPEDPVEPAGVRDVSALPMPQAPSIEEPHDVGHAFKPSPCHAGRDSDHEVEPSLLSRRLICTTWNLAPLAISVTPGLTVA